MNGSMYSPGKAGSSLPLSKKLTPTTRLSNEEVEWCSDRVCQLIRKGWRVPAALDQAWADFKAMQS